MPQHQPKPRAPWFLLLAVVALFTGGCVSRHADLRERRAAADALITRWVEASGGAERIAQIECVTSEVTMEFGPDIPPLSMRVIEADRGRFRYELITPAFGPVLTVSNGVHGLRWNEHLGRGLIPPAELERLIRKSDPAFLLKINRHYPFRIRLRDMEVDGRMLQVVDLRDRAGTHETWLFDPLTGLRVREIEGDQVTTYSDFRTIDGVTTAFAAESLSNGIKFKASSITIGPAPADEVFALDPEQVSEAVRIDDILLRYYKASGGDALGRVMTRRSELITSIPAQALNIETVSTQKRPMKIVSEQNIPGMGSFYQGYDGQTGWASSELQGYRELQGAELKQLLNGADLGAEARLRETSPFRKRVGERELPAGPATGIALAGYGGPSGTYWFDRATGRIVRIESNIITGPDSHFAMTMTMEDFRKVDGVWIPFVTHIENPTIKMITTLQSVRHNVPVDDAVFAPRKED